VSEQSNREDKIRELKKCGDRYNEGKNRLELIPPACIEGIGEVMTFGAKKYAPYNWAKGMSFIEVLGSLKRHILAFEKGEELDKESGLPHLDHAACNLAFLQTYMTYYEKYEKFDDRFNFGK